MKEGWCYSISLLEAIAAYYNQLEINSYPTQYFWTAYSFQDNS